MFVKHINPIFLYKLLKSPQEMWTLLAYLKTIYAHWNHESQGPVKPEANVIGYIRNLHYLGIQAVIGYKMNKCDDVLIRNTNVLSIMNQLFCRLLPILVINYNKV